MFIVEGVPERAEGLLPSPEARCSSSAGSPDRSARRGRGRERRRRARGAGRPSMRSRRIQPRPGRLLEGIHNRLDLLVGRLVLPRDHAGRVPVFEGKRIGHGGHLMVDLPSALRRLRGAFRPRQPHRGGTWPPCGRSGSVREEPSVHPLAGLLRAARFQSGPVAFAGESPADAGNPGPSESPCPSVRGPMPTVSAAQEAAMSKGVPGSSRSPN